ncbi:extracellular solute-binding protein [Paenibacillus sp. 7124]|uniref:Extracellular solute-binding protein n=1 Tax=Paenibacillus apii TaxID=1850370 RepID=A0A6M1PTJ2_9BACL|nr:extracellular solute-binding protein [Paenibacillus apii]NGM85352.1 extracellular solute-binding protein [Paenibacillus apii]NJJ41774.1 extracellular solute-binding protein [Paenibacillus apii]
MKKVLKMACIAILCLAATACGNGSGGNNGAAGGTTPPSDAAAASAAPENTASANDKLIVYTNANSDGRGEWLIAEASKAGFDIELVGAGGADLTNRLIAEKNNPTADVVYGLNNMLYENLKKENILARYVPKWAGEVEEGLSDPEGYYHALVKQAILLGYNPEAFTPETAPKDWTDLYQNDAYKGKYEAPTLLGQMTPRLVVAGILTRYTDPSGDLGISEEGWNAVRQLYNNGVPAVEGEDFYANLASGKTPLGAIVSGTLAKKEEQYKVKAGIVSPEIGVPVIVEQAAIVNGTKKQATAERFLDWLGSAEVQGAFAAQFKAMPANKQAAEQADPAIKALYSTLKTQPLDWAFLADHIDQWVEKIELQIMK